MKKIVITFCVLCFAILSYAQMKVEYKPEYPFNRNDTILVEVSENFTETRNDEILKFELHDNSWDCKSITFVHYLNRKISDRNINGITYKTRIMDNRYFDKEKISSYKSFNFASLKDYAFKNKGCNNLEAYLSKSTLYFVLNKKDKHYAYEVLPLVWGVRED